MNAPPLTDTDIEGDLQAIQQTLACIISMLDPPLAGGVALMLEEVLKNAKGLEGQDERLDAILKRMTGTIRIFGRTAIEASKRGDAGGPVQ